MTNFDGYNHLNKDDRVGFSVPEIAKLLKELNYGMVRMLTEIVKVREASEDYKKYDEHKKHTQELRKLIENGWY